MTRTFSSGLLVLAFALGCGRSNLRLESGIDAGPSIDTGVAIDARGCGDRTCDVATENCASPRTVSRRT